MLVTQGVTPSEFREDLDTHKTRMNELLCGEESMTICSAVLIPACDGQTDGQTDKIGIANTCFSIADSRKKSHNTFYFVFSSTCYRPNGPLFFSKKYSRIENKLESTQKVQTSADAD